MGSFRSPPTAADVSPLLVVGVRDGSPTLFSDLIPLETLPAGDCKISGVRLKPGRALRGQLSPNIERPIKNGKVELTIAASVANAPSFRNSLYWKEVVEIAEDGTFEFASLPRGIPAQLLATCERGVSVSAPASEIPHRFSYVTTPAHAQSMHDTLVIAQQFAADEDYVVLNMEPTAECEFLVTDSDGKPIVSVRRLACRQTRRSRRDLEASSASTAWALSRR